MLQKETKYTI